MKIWKDDKADIGYWDFQVNGVDAMYLHREVKGNFVARAYKCGQSFVSPLHAKTVDQAKIEAESWYGSVLNQLIRSTQTQLRSLRKEHEAMKEA